ncbi:hypothetical protein EV421DRAFT_1710929, partial [Armillaria borealis]
MKPGLKTHAIFDCIRSIFQHSREHPDDPQRSRKDRARKLMTQMVNVLGAKTELGSPMICTYLLRLPDHYTNRVFATFYWKSFVAEARNYWKADGESLDDVKITLKKGQNNVVGISPVEDYIHRPTQLEDLSLYDWISLCEHVSNKSSPTTSKKDTGDEPIKLDDLDNDLEDRGDLYNFSRDHPLHESHHVRMSPDKDKKVPNFVGGMLPRKDRGDREYYCASM